MTKLENDVNYDSDYKTKRDHDDQLFNLIRCKGEREEDGFSDCMFKVKLSIAGKPILMEIDTGSSNTIISKELFDKKFKEEKLKKSNLQLKYYTGEKLVPVGYFISMVEYGDKCEQLPLYVIQGGGPPLVGKDWLEKLEIIKWNKNMYHLQAEEILKLLIEKYKDVFDGTLGTYSLDEGRLKIKKEARPKFCKARPVPFALKDKVEQEIDRLVMSGVLVPVDISEWATPIVPVLKENGEVRICGDYKITLNPCLELDRYPVPRIEELFASLGGGRFYTKIDLSHAYQQVRLNKESRECVTINTHKGLFQYQRVPYGVASAPGIFQRIMDTLVKGIPGVVTFLDDVLITGKTEEEHWSRVESVLNKLQKAGLRVQEEKCEFAKKSVQFLGHVINEFGLQTTKEKVEAILEAPEPKDIKQLQAVLGLTNYYAKFVPDISQILHPMYQLLKKNTKFVFNKDCRVAFEKVKQKLATAPILAHYDPNLELILTCDASAYGLGAILSQRDKQGKERPVAYSSRTLNKAETNYASIDREALAIFWGVKKFNQYVYGRDFLLRTDHKPLVAIFGPKRGIPQMGACRLQRYALFLAEYTFKIEYVKSVDNWADALSRMPMIKEDDGKVEVSYLKYIEEAQLPISSLDIQRETMKDPDLMKIMKYIKLGWPKYLSKNENNLELYFRKREELSIEQGIILWGYRVVVPEVYRTRLLCELHESHFGMVKMKMGARSYFWWPHMDREIEEMVNSCAVCIQERRNPPKGKLHAWNYPDKPFGRIHVDFLGPMFGKLYLLVTDAFSKWVEAFEVRSTSAEEVIPKLRGIFAQFGLPEHLVSDNGPPFTSDKFKLFLRGNGVKHTYSPPYHPATNGLSENQVKTFKHKVKTTVKSGVELEKAVNCFLYNYRKTPHCTTGETPAKLFLGRELRSKFDMLRPSLKDNVARKTEKQQKYYKGKREQNWEVGDRVWIRDYRSREKKWIQGVVEDKLGPVTYNVRIGEDRVWKRHMNQMFVNKTDFNLSNVDDQEDLHELLAYDHLEINDEVIGGRDGLGLGKPSIKEGLKPLNNEVMAAVQEDLEGPCKEPEKHTMVPEKLTEEPVRKYPLRVRKKKTILDL